MSLLTLRRKRVREKKKRKEGKFPNLKEGEKKKKKKKENPRSKIGRKTEERCRKVVGPDDI